MEPRLVIFENDGLVVQMFLAGEDNNLMELPVSTIGEGITYLMAAYYVFGVEYPSQYKPLLYFFQDMIMDKADNGKTLQDMLPLLRQWLRIWYKLLPRSVTLFRLHLVRYDMVYCIVCLQLCCQKHIIIAF